MPYIPGRIVGCQLLVSDIVRDLRPLLNGQRRLLLTMRADKYRRIFPWCATVLVLLEDHMQKLVYILDVRR
jgi:hypothetical protein